MGRSPSTRKSSLPMPDGITTAEDLFAHFTELEAQLQQVREGLTHSHRLATLGTIASIVAHEYNNILTPMISYAQLALSNPSDTELMKKALEKSLFGAERAAKISASLLGFAREEDAQHVARLPEVVHNALACLAREPKRDGIALTVDVPDIAVAITPLNLEQVLVNLILNAKQAMRKTGGSLRLSAQVEGDMVQLDVADTGPGIPEEIRDRLFEPFVTRRPAGSTDGKGTGLGLCICRDLIRNAGGSLSFTTATGQGATFHITLPKADTLLGTPATSPTDAAPAKK